MLAVFDILMKKPSKSLSNENFVTSFGHVSWKDIMRIRNIYKEMMNYQFNVYKYRMDHIFKHEFLYNAKSNYISYLTTKKPNHNVFIKFKNIYISFKIELSRWIKKQPVFIKNINNALTSEMIKHILRKSNDKIEQEKKESIIHMIYWQAHNTFADYCVEIKYLKKLYVKLLCSSPEYIFLLSMQKNTNKVFTNNNSLRRIVCSFL